MKLEKILARTVFPLIFIIALQSGNSLAQGMRAPGPAGVFDIKHFLSELEIDTKFQDKIKKKENELTEKLQERQKQFQKLFKARLKGIGEQSTEEEKQGVIQLEEQINRQLRNLVESGRRELQEYHQEMIDALHSELRPSLRKIGKERGLSSVVFRDDIFLLIDEELDLTDEMIDYYRNNSDLLDSLRQNVLAD